MKEKIKEAIFTGIIWGTRVAIAVVVVVVIISFLESFGMATWDKQVELDCYKKLEKSQCEILFNN